MQAPAAILPRGDVARVTVLVVLVVVVVVRRQREVAPPGFFTVTN